MIVTQRHTAHRQGLWHQLPQARQVVLSLAVVVAGVLFRAALRHWLLEALSTLLILGGVIAAPVVSLVGWVGMLLPEHAPLHALAPILVVASMFWLGLGLCWAHIHPASRHTA